MANRTHSLFHFTRDIATLRAILKNGHFWPQYCLEDVRWIEQASCFVAFPMVSFCDIPVTRIHEHIDFYGSYGIGMSQAWGIRKGLNPVLYVNHDSFVADLVNRAIDLLSRTSNQVWDSESREYREAMHLLAYTKPMVGISRKQNQRCEKSFYEESEWRYLPRAVFRDLKIAIHEQQYRDQTFIAKANTLSKKKGALAFNLPDIRYIFIRHSQELSAMVDFIGRQLKGYPATQLKVLLTRIVALDNLWEDL